MTNTWHDVWGARGLDHPEADDIDELRRLMAADGYDTGFGSMTVEAWSAFVARTSDTLKVLPGDSMFEVGCGAGAFLYPPYQAGVKVSGIDYSERLIRSAAVAMPDGQFEVQDAAEFSTLEAADVVVSCGVFLYFDSLDYAAAVIARMCAKAKRAVAILDIPDLATAEQALADRQAASGGPEAYAARYAGLPHQAYDREWVAANLEMAGLVDVHVESQDIRGYENSAFRFNVLGRTPDR